MTIQICLIDDETDRHETLKSKWNEILESAGLAARIECYSNFEDVAPLKEKRPHLIIVDNVAVSRGGKERDNEGMRFISEHKLEFGDSLFILSTNKTYSIEVLGQRFPGPDFIVPKTALSNRSYQAYCGKLLRDSIRRLPFGDLNIPKASDGKSTAHFRPELTSLIEQCLYSACGEMLVGSIDQLNLTGMSGGKSGSHVFKVEMFSQGQSRNAPLVLKVTEGRHTKGEVNRYNSYARLHMPNEMRVDLLGTGEAGNYSAALYAFAFGAHTEISTAGNEFRVGVFDSLNTILQKIFCSPAVGWYDHVRKEKDVESFFANSAEYAPRKDQRRVDQLRVYTNRFFEKKKPEISLDHFRTGSYSFRQFRRFLGAFENRTMPEVVCHGDLNSNNIILDEKRTSLSLIDFEYTGYDSIYKDFVSLECSLRVDESNLSAERLREFSALVNLEKAMLNRKEFGVSSKRKSSQFTDYLERICEVRKVCQDVCDRVGVELDTEVYALSLGMHLFKLLGIGDWNDNNASLLLASFVAIGEYLEAECG